MKKFIVKRHKRGIDKRYEDFLKFYQTQRLNSNLILIQIYTFSSLITRQKIVRFLNSKFRLMRRKIINIEK